MLKDTMQINELYTFIIEWNCVVTCNVVYGCLRIYIWTKEM